MVPNYIRKSVDAIRTDIPLSFLASAAANLSKFGLTAGMVNIGEPEDSGDNTVNHVLQEHNFIVNFLQKTKVKTRTYMTEANERALKTLKTALKDNGLAIPIKEEYKQRAQI